MTQRQIYGLLAGTFAFLGLLAAVLLVSSPGERNNPGLNATPQEITPTGNKNTGSKTITVDARQLWVDTGFQVNKDDTVTIEATGQVNVASPGNGADKWVGPEGWGYIPLFYCDGQPCKYVYRTPDSLGCLIAKVGTSKAFKIGSHYRSTFQSDGMLYLSVNDSVSDHYGTTLDDSSAAAVMFSNNRGAFEASVQIERRAK